MIDKVKVGCCGFPVGRKKYYSEFNVVEIQQTFYQPPSFKTLHKWRREAPSGFEFAIKAWQLITHPPSSPTYRKIREPLPLGKGDAYGFFRPTDEVFSAWERMKEIARVLEAKIIVFQSPASFRPLRVNEKNMREFFKKIKRENFILVWEPRGRWEKNKILSLCEELDLVHCVDPFKNECLTQKKIFYFRLHGKDGYSYRYTEKDLLFLKDKILNLSPLPSYVMFNNTHMFQDAVLFKNLLSFC